MTQEEIARIWPKLRHAHMDLWEAHKLFKELGMTRHAVTAQGLANILHDGLICELRDRR